jgi:hypothetical protein
VAGEAAEGDAVVGSGAGCREGAFWPQSARMEAAAVTLGNGGDVTTPGNGGGGDGGEWMRRRRRRGMQAAATVGNGGLRFPPNQGFSWARFRKTGEGGNARVRENRGLQYPVSDIRGEIELDQYMRGSRGLNPFSNNQLLAQHYF